MKLEPNVVAVSGNATADPLAPTEAGASKVY
jgi:hypothetical protein